MNILVRKKKVVIHIVITLLFIIYLVSANLIFNRLILLKGESKLVNEDFEFKNTIIMHSIDSMDSIKIKWKNVLCIRGWAFLEDEDMKQSEKYLVLQSESSRFIYTVFPIKREDVKRIFENSENLSLEKSGFRANIPIDVLKDGVYRIDICIKKDNNVYLKQGKDFISKINGRIIPKYISRNFSELLVDQASDLGCFDDIKMCIDYIKDEEDDIIEISGWGFMEGVNADKSKIYTVFRSREKTYIFDSQMRIREDVTNAFFEEYKMNLDSCGFNTNILKNQIESGKYQIGIYIENGDKKALVYTDKYYEK